MWNTPLDKKQSSADKTDLEAALDDAIAANASSRPTSAVGPGIKVSPGIAPRGGILGALQTREGQLGALSMILLIFQVRHGFKVYHDPPEKAALAGLSDTRVCSDALMQINDL